MKFCRKPVEWNKLWCPKKTTLWRITCLMKDREMRSQDTMPWSISSKKAVRVKANISPKLQGTRQPLWPHQTPDITGQNTSWKIVPRTCSLSTYWVPLSTKRASVPMPSMLMNSAAKVGSADSLASSFRASSRASMPWDWIRSRSWRAARACQKGNRNKDDHWDELIRKFSQNCETFQCFCDVTQYLYLNVHLVNVYRGKKKNTL